MTEIIVTVDQGQLQGKTGKDFHGNDYYSFQGIPYAKPPFGELRFKAPQPPVSWTGIRDATHEGNSCYAKHILERKTIIGSEDCLFLNVFTPNLPRDNSSPLKPVMVWIHGGSFIYGSGTTQIHGPDNLMTEDIVLVTMNYRLGILGFLSLNDTALGVPGNAGLKDIVMALKWVQKNIKHFSGDPNNVTVFGVSSGGVIVHFLTLSPMAKGLFHKAIPQSGCALCPWGLARNISTDLANILGIDPTNEAEILKTLRNLSVEELFEVGAKVEDPNISVETFIIHKQRAYAPIVEKPSNEEAFLSENPLDLMLNGKFNKVPYMTGFTNNEGLLLKFFMRLPKIKFMTNFELAIPYPLNVRKGSDLSKLISEKIKDFYAAEDLSPQEKLEKFYMLQSDIFLLTHLIKTTKLFVARSPCPVYLYRISLESKLNFYKNLGTPEDKGVCHTDELGYLFKTAYTPKVKSCSIEEIYIKRFIKLWTNFARYGDPNPKTKDPLINITWKPVKKNELNFIDIGKELTVGVNPSEVDRIAFWEDIEKLVEQPQGKL